MSEFLQKLEGLRARLQALAAAGDPDPRVGRILRALDTGDPDVTAGAADAAELVLAERRESAAHRWH